MADGEAWKVTQYVIFLTCLSVNHGTQVSCTRAFEHILTADRNIYNNNVPYTLETDNNDFQNLVDDVLNATYTMIIMVASVASGS